MKIIFRCSSPYQLFIATLIVEIYYKNDHTIMIIDGAIAFNISVEKFIGSDIWNEIHVIGANGNRIKNEEESILQIINGNSIDAYHFFTWGDYISRFLFNNVSDKTRIIMTDEGTLTYNPIESYKTYISRFADLQAKINLKRVNEVWILEPLLYDYSLESAVVRKIESNIIIGDKNTRNKLLKKLNFLFSYHGLDNEVDIIYFDGYYAATNMMPLNYEKRFLSNLVECIKNYKYIVKLHPGEKENVANMRYEEIRPTILESKFIPWELIYLNEFNNRCSQLILVSIMSSSLFTTQLLSDGLQGETPIILLHNIVDHYLNIPGKEHNSFPIVQRYKSAKPNCQVFEPYTFYELNLILNELFNDNNKIKINEDSHWIKQEYIGMSKFFGNTITSSSVILKSDSNTNGKEVIEKQIYVDYSYNKYSMNFEINSQHITGDIQVVWKPFENYIYNKIKLDNISIVDNHQNLIEIPLNKVTFYNDIDEDGYLQLKQSMPFIKMQFQTYSNIDAIKINFFTSSTIYYEDLIHYKLLNDKAQGYYKVLLKWLDIKENKLEFNCYFKKNNYKNIAIYGNGELGIRLYDEIKDELDHVFYITSYPNSSYKEGNIYSINDFVMEKIHCDVIIITPMFAFDSIKEELIQRGIKKEIISIEDVVSNILKDVV